MNWFGLGAAIFARLPIERWLIKPRDTTKPLEELATRLSERQKEAPILRNPTSTISKAAKGTACLSCSQDHFLTTSAAISEGIRFAREKGVRDPEAVRRIRIALGELDVMERIDLAPEEMTKLKGKERELADWALKKSRELRHDITAINDVEFMEQTAAKASQITEEFMSRLWEIPEEECETCGELREKLREFIERRKRERAVAGK